MEKKAQVWVETVIYTLIGLAIIGILLAVSKPKIDSTKDELLIDQSVNSLNVIHGKVYEAQQKGVGNRRTVDLKVSKGEFVVDGNNNSLYWIIDSAYEYSDPDEIVPLGDIKIKTTEKGDRWEIKLFIEYDFDLKFDEGNVEKKFEAAPSPYSLIFENLGGGVIDVRGG